MVLSICGRYDARFTYGYMYVCECDSGIDYSYVSNKFIFCVLNLIFMLSLFNPISCDLIGSFSISSMRSSLFRLHWTRAIM